MLDTVHLGRHPICARGPSTRCALASASRWHWIVLLPSNEAGCAAAAGAGAGAGDLAARLARYRALVASGAGAWPALVAVRRQHTVQPRQRRAPAADRDQGG